MTTSAVLQLLERPKPERLWGCVLAVGAAALWAQMFELIPYPLDLFRGVF